MLRVNNLSKAYGDVTALDGVSFTINHGEVVALLGANGSGKTTTVNAICSLLEWDSGDIFIDDESVRSSSSYLRKIGAVLGGCRNTNWRLTAKQNAAYFAKLKNAGGQQVRDRINALHAELGLDEHERKEVRKLSTGNKQKAALLSALSHDPDFVLLDEPTLGLDFTTVEQLQNVINRQVKDSNQGFLITSHDLDFIENICHKVVVLERGQILFDGDIKQLKAQLFHYELRVKTSKKLESSSLEPLWHGRHALNLVDEQWVVQFDEPSQALPMLAYLHQQEIKPEQLQIYPLSIEKAYQTLIQEHRI